MLSFFNRSPSGLKASRRALNELAEGVRRLDRQRKSHGILSRLGPLLADMSRELHTYEKLVSRGEDHRTAAGGFRFSLGLLSTVLRDVERELIVESGLVHPRKSPLEQIYGRLESLRIVSRQLNGPETKFQRVLNELVRKSGVTAYAIAGFHGWDSSYLYKMMRGERGKPGRELVEMIATALMAYSPRISEKDANRLMQSAGYPPLKLSKK